MESPPTRQQMRRVLELHEVSLLSSRHLQPWAVARIEALAAPPAWLCELATLRYRGHVADCLRGYVFSPPFEAFDERQLCDYAVAGLLQRYQDRALAWAGFLEAAGGLTDGRDCGVEPCEYYYALLNELEDDEYAVDTELRQAAAVRKLLTEPLAEVARDRAPFVAAFREDVTERRARCDDDTT